MQLALIKIIPGVGGTRDVSAAAVAGQSPPLNQICDGVIPLAPVPQTGGGTMEMYTPGNYYSYRLAPGNDVSSVGSGNYLILDFCDVLAEQGIDLQPWWFNGSGPTFGCHSGMHPAQHGFLHQAGCCGRSD